MNENVLKNQKAWEYQIYNWRCKSQGSPEILAKKIVNSPEAFIRNHEGLLNNVKGKKIANICGSDGQRAVALALMGADVTIFDISEPQKEYAILLAKAANVSINYVVTDFCSIDRNRYSNYFDYTYCEGGILHYFHDLNVFFKTIKEILVLKGMMICSDYHPFQKTIHVEPPIRNVEQTHGNYFDTSLHQGHVPYSKFFPKDQQKKFPSCILRFYSLSEILNSMYNSGLFFNGLFEYPRYDNPNFPGEFTLIAKNDI